MDARAVATILLLEGYALGKAGSKYETESSKATRELVVCWVPGPPSCRFKRFLADFQTLILESAFSTLRGILRFVFAPTVGSKNEVVRTYTSYGNIGLQQFQHYWQRIMMVTGRVEQPKRVFVIRSLFI